MVDAVSDRTTLFTKAVEKAKTQAEKSRFSASLSSAQERLADLVVISPEAKAKALSAKKADGYLRIFGAFLKLFNAQPYGIRPTTYGVEDLLKGKTTTFQKDV